MNAIRTVIKAEIEETKRKINDTCIGLFWCAILIAVFGLPLWWLLPDRWTDVIKYTTIYHVPASEVHYESKPRDCEWGFSPMGDKGCHYEKQVDFVRDSAYGQVSGVWVSWNKVTE